MRTVAYDKNDLANAFITFQTLIKRVGKYNEKLKERIATQAHNCHLSAESYDLNAVRTQFIALDPLIEQVSTYNADLGADLADESDVCFDIAAVIAEEGGAEWIV